MTKAIESHGSERDVGLVVLIRNYDLRSNNTFNFIATVKNVFTNYSRESNLGDTQQYHDCINVTPLQAFFKPETK